MAEDEKKPSLEVASVTLLSQNPLSCNMCGKVFASRRELLVHQWSHKERQNFFCPNCEKNFNNENQFKRHMHVHTKEGRKYVTCDICKKVFRNNRILEEHHVKDHTGQKPYRCGTCGIQFSWRENLKKHLHTHIDKPFACTICHESFRDEESLELHSKIHKREMKELEKREQERRDQEDRERRRELHKQMGVFSVIPPPASDFKVKEEDYEEDERGFKCKACGQSFKYAFTLEAHMKGHMEEGMEVKKEGEVIEKEIPTNTAPKITANPVFDKPHTCEICHQTFRWAFCLDAHVKIHKQGYDAKVEKEKERKAIKTAKEKRRQEALRKALAQQQQLENEAEEPKQEGTVVIVVEPLTEEEKARASGASNGKMRKPRRKRTRREAMAEQLALEGRQPDDFDENADISFGEFGEGADLESLSSDNKNSEEDESGIDLKAPRLSIPNRSTPVQERIRGRAKTRGGARIGNHIDLNEVVASIGKESRENLCRTLGRVNTRGGGASRGHSTRPSVQQHIKQEDSEEEEDDEEEEDENDEAQDGDIGESEEEQQDESMDEGSDVSSGYEAEEGEVLIARNITDEEYSDQDEPGLVHPGQSGDEQSDEEREEEQWEEDSDSRCSDREEQDASGPEDHKGMQEQYIKHEQVSGEEDSGEEEDEEEEEEQESGCEGNEEDSKEEGEETNDVIHRDYREEEEEDEEEQESGSEQVYEGEEEGDQEEDDESADGEEEGSHTSTQVNEAAQTMLGLDTSDDEFDDDDDDDDIIDDDVDEQELLKLKMKVYSCELCSKAFVQADLLMEHKVNYHQQNGEAVRNILVTKTPKVSPHTKVISGPRSHSTLHRKSR